METPHDVKRMRIVGGNVALDFINTQSGPPDGAPEDDVIRDYSDVVAVGRYVGLVTEREVNRLLRKARRDPGSARETYERALRLRAYLYELFSAIALARRPPGPSLVALRDEESEAVARAALVAGDAGFAWAWADDDLARPLWPVVHAAVELLTGGPLDRIKRCAGCRFLFVDESKNRSRKWCSMEDCGTTEKVRRYVARRAAGRRRTNAD